MVAIIFQFFSKGIITHHDASIGSGFLTTRNMYSTQVISLNNKFAIRIRKPETKMKKQKLGQV